MDSPLLGSMRSHACGSLRLADAGREVRLAGWVARRRDHGGVVFLDLRDASGVVQVVVRPEEAPAAAQAAHAVRAEDCVRVTGTVSARPAGNENPDLATGEVEVVVAELEVLAPSATPPFPLEGRAEPDEALRLRYRYLDLRRPASREKLLLRARATAIARRVLEAHGFIEVETPYLTRSTPEGARDFLVPTHLAPGRFYALPQSPQLFKQLLMVAGLERYYQFARCFRDEALRADRQPEFTQLDIEVSFVDEDDVLGISEAVMRALWQELLGVELPRPFPRLSYAEAMRRYGTDKPDLRYGMELVDLSEALAGTQVAVFSRALEAGGSVLALVLPGGATASRKELDGLVEWARSRGAGGLAWIAVAEDGVRSPLAKFLSDEERAGLPRAAGAGPGDLILIAAGETAKTQSLLGELRTKLAAERGLVPEGRWAFTWIVDWPLFEWDEEEGRWDFVTHPFTSPSVKWEDRFAEAPGEATSRAYDLVLNGYELGGGSIRINKPEVQRRVFEVLGIGREEAEERFGFLLRGLEFGAPPHGGIAFGWDRVVMLLAGADAIREVIAFPKTQSGADLLTGAPSEVDPGQLAEVNLRPAPGRG